MNNPYTFSEWQTAEIVRVTRIARGLAAALPEKERQAKVAEIDSPPRYDPQDMSDAERIYIARGFLERA